MVRWTARDSFARRRHVEMHLVLGEWSDAVGLGWQRHLDSGLYYFRAIPT